MLYGTTRRFLEVFGLDRLEDLPTLRDIEEIAPELGLELPEAAPAAEALDRTAIDFDDAEPVGKPH